MIAMRMMQMAINQIINVIAMWNSLVATTRSMYMGCIMTGTMMVRCAFRRVLLADLNDMLIDMVTVRMVEVTIVKIINVITVANGGMTASCLMFVIVIIVMGSVAITHNYFLYKICSP